MEATLSFHMDSKHSEDHDDRTIFVPYVDSERTKDNVYYSGNMTRQEAFDLLFADAVAEYNAKQKRPDRQIGSYLQKLLDAEKQQKQTIQEKRSAGASYKELAKYKKRVHPSYQFIVTVGNMQDNPELIAKDGEQAHIAKAILEEYMNGFQERNPNAFLYHGALHGDEISVWHGHFTIVWYADDCPKGMKRQVSQKRALEAMGFVSDTEKGEDGKLHLAIEKWQNREREVLREICKNHGITIVAGNGSKEHLDRERYIIKKQKEENDRLMATVNDQAGVVLSEKEKVEEQVHKIEEFLTQTAEGRNFTIYSQIEELHSKSLAYDAQQEEQRKLLAQLWDDYKAENTAYWEMYRSQKQDLYNLLQSAKQGKQYNDKMLKQYLYALSDRGENLLFKLFSLIAVFTLVMRKMYLDAELERVKKEYIDFKNNARVVLQASKDTSVALKSKDFESIEDAMNGWHMAIAGMDEQLSPIQHDIVPRSQER